MRISSLGAATACAVLLLSAFSSAAPTPPPPSNSLSTRPSLPTAIRGRPSRLNKYFHEPGYESTLVHYDKRYFHGVASDEERTDTQSHMMRAYLNFFHEQDLDTWIAHGTLLGWWWNGKRLPWDLDMDTQVSDKTLKRLGDVYNQTHYHYISEDGQTTREYLLDVNPWIWQRDRGDGMNVIDARWIDIRNGLFIDITGLSQVEPDHAPGVWSCKNSHRYKTAELYPMRETMFEGVAAKVPYEYDKILVDEYHEKALVRTWFNGHQWDANRKEWVKTQATLDKEQRKQKEKEEREKKEKQRLEQLHAVEMKKMREVEAERARKPNAEPDASKHTSRPVEATINNEEKALDKAQMT